MWTIVFFYNHATEKRRKEHFLHQKLTFMHKRIDTECIFCIWKREMRGNGMEKALI